MTASFRNILCILALSFVALHARVEAATGGDLEQFILRSAPACLAEAGRIRLKITRPCPLATELRAKLEPTERSDSLTDYLLNNEFNCQSNRKQIVCRYVHTSLVRPTVNGIQVNPEFEDAIDVTVTYPSNERGRLQGKVKVDVKRFE